MDYLFKYLNVVLLASVKYFWTTPYAFLLSLNWVETIVMLEIGGLTGFLFFYYLFAFLWKEIKILWPKVYLVTPAIFKVRFETWRTEQRIKKQNARKFTRRNKMIVKIRDRWGMVGIVILTPVLLSIPIGALIGTKYFRHTHGFIPWMLFSIAIWGAISVAFFSFLKGI